MTQPNSTAQLFQRTLILEIAVPDFNCEDYRLDGPDRFMNEALAEAAEQDPDGATPEWLGWQALEDSGLTTSRVNLSILLGSKDGIPFRDLLLDMARASVREAAAA